MAVWDLSISIEELGPEAPPLKISVTSDLHIGGVILKVVEKSRKLLMFVSLIVMVEFMSLFYIKALVLVKVKLKRKIIVVCI